MTYVVFQPGDSILICLDEALPGPNAIAFLKQLVEDASKSGHYLKQIDNGPDLGVDIDGVPIRNNWRNKARIYLEKLPP